VIRPLFLVDNLAPNGGQRACATMAITLYHMGLIHRPGVCYVQNDHSEDLVAALRNADVKTHSWAWTRSEFRVGEAKHINLPSYDIVNIHTWEGALVNKIGDQLLRDGVPVLWTQHGATIQNAHGQSCSHGVVSPGYPYAVADPKNTNPIYYTPIALSPHPVMAAALDHDVARQQLPGLKPNQPVILTISRCVGSKGFDLFMDVCEHLYDDGLDACFVFIGAMAKTPGYQEFSSRMHARNWTFIEYPFVPYQQAMQLLCAADVFVLASRIESYCLRLYEAVALGVPIVTHELHVGQDIRQYMRVAPFGDTLTMAKHVAASLADDQRRDPSTDFVFMDAEMAALRTYAVMRSMLDGTACGLTPLHYDNAQVPDTIKAVRFP